MHHGVMNEGLGLKLVLTVHKQEKKRDRTARVQHADI